MKTSYCSLKDAFKTPDFSKESDEIILQNKELHQMPYTIQKENTLETFSKDCDYIQSHMNSCTRCSVPGNSSDMTFNELLNIILILLMIWVIIYKPKL